MMEVASATETSKNFGKPHYTAQHPRRQLSSNLSSSEPEILTGRFQSMENGCNWLRDSCNADFCVSGVDPSRFITHRYFFCS